MSPLPGFSVHVYRFNRVSRAIRVSKPEAKTCCIVSSVLYYIIVALLFLPLVCLIIFILTLDAPTAILMYLQKTLCHPRDNDGRNLVM